MTHHWLVAGVGRSGTTAIYEVLQTLARRSRRSFDYFYEPYFWGPPTWGPRFRDVASAFATTSSIHADGLGVHLSTPLFASESIECSPAHAEFIAKMYNKDGSSLAKIIRGCGRLRDFLETCPELKLVFVMRNPLDCVNSIMSNFSYFGDEFHPSDLPRFRSELQALGRPQGTFVTECEAASAWWREMNQAALRAIEPHRKRVFIAPYEAYAADHDATLRLLGQFLSTTVKEKAQSTLDEPVGQITREINLRSIDVAHVEPLQSAYFDLIGKISDVPMGKKARATFKKIRRKYKAAAPGSFAPDVARDASPLRVRALLKRQIALGQTAATAIGRAREDLRLVEGQFDGKDVRER